MSDTSKFRTPSWIISAPACNDNCPKAMVPKWKKKTFLFFFPKNSIND
jgi:hypothetical protein